LDSFAAKLSYNWLVDVMPLVWVSTELYKFYVIAASYTIHIRSLIMNASLFCTKLLTFVHFVAMFINNERIVKMYTSAEYPNENSYARERIVRKSNRSF
jgi:hypothetical protein